MLDDEHKRLLAEATRMYNEGRVSEALPKFEQCFSLFDEGDHSSVEFADFCGNYGSALAESGDLKLAEWMFNSALLIYGANGKQTDVARIYFNLGNVYQYMNNRQKCSDSYKEALEGYRACGDAFGEGVCLLQLVNFYAGLGVFDRAREWLAEVEKVGDSAKKKPEFNWSWRFQQAKLALHDGQTERGLELLEEALGYAQKVGNATYIEETENAIARVRLKQGLTEDTLSLLEQAYQASKVRKDRSLYSNSYQLAHALLAKGEWERSLAFYEECLELMEYTRGRLDGAERFHWMEQVAAVSHEYCVTLFSHGRIDQALEISERGQGRVLLDLMFRHQIKLQGERTIRAAGHGRIILDAPNISEIRLALRDANVHLFKLLETQGGILAWFISPDGSIESWRADSALSVLSRLIGLLLQSDEASSQEAVEDVRMIRAYQPSKRVSWQEFKKELVSLYEALFPSNTREYLEHHNGRLLVIPHLSFFHVPWTSLGPKEGPPLGAHWEIGITPSLGVFMQLDRRRDPQIWRGLADFQVPVAAIGDCGPQIVEVPVIGIPNAPTFKLDFCELPGTREEVMRIAEILRGAVVVGSDAHVAVVRALLSVAGVVHLATHGFWHPTGELSFLVLAPSPTRIPGTLFATGEPGALFAAQLMGDNFRTRAELVTLSGCQTGLGGSHPDTYINLAHSFLVAGARSVLVSLWPIRDDAAVAFMEEFYLELRDGRSPAEALQRAQAEMKKSILWNEEWNWSGFILVGNPFHRFTPETDTPQFSGPSFCGGDCLWVDEQEGSVLPLKSFENERQANNESWIIRQGEILHLTRDSN